MIYLDIIATDREKIVINGIVSLVRARFGKRAAVENIHKELHSYDNQCLKNILTTLDKCIINIKSEKWQPKNISQKTELALWFAIHHPDFRLLFATIVKEMTGDDSLFDLKVDKEFNILDRKVTSLVIKYAHKMLSDGISFHQLLEEIHAGSNPAVSNILGRVAIAFKESKYIEKPEGAILYNIIALGLWFCQHDTAYRDEFFWIAYHLSNNQLKKLIKPYHLSPNKWYVNLYSKGKTQTKKLRETGKIGKYGFSPIEKMCVPSMRQREIQKNVNKLKKIQRGY